LIHFLTFLRLFHRFDGFDLPDAQACANETWSAICAWSQIFAALLLGRLFMARRKPSNLTRQDRAFVDAAYSQPLDQQRP
jgi:hypothetical protein